MITRKIIDSRKIRRIYEGMNHCDLCIVYRDEIGQVMCCVDERYGISFESTYAYFDVHRDDGTSESVKVPVRDLIYVGKPEGF